MGFSAEFQASEWLTIVFCLRAAWRRMKSSGSARWRVCWFVQDDFTVVRKIRERSRRSAEKGRQDIITAMADLITCFYDAVSSAGNSGASFWKWATRPPYAALHTPPSIRRPPCAALHAPPSMPRSSAISLSHRSQSSGSGIIHKTEVLDRDERQAQHPAAG
jgi:hypothetical protein